MIFIGNINMQSNFKILSTVKVDKLSFGRENVNSDLVKNFDKVIRKYYEEFNNNDKFNKLNRSITPTKQRRKGYNDFNHNLQMIPLDQFLMFLKELRNIVGQKLNVYEIHLAKDILVQNEPVSYIKLLNNHEYLNSYNAYTEEANSPNTLYISRKRDLNANGDLKLRIKFYDKLKQLIGKSKIENLPLKEPTDEKELKIQFINDKMVLPLNGLNILRCEIELRENYLPYNTIDEMIEALENNTFQDTVEKHYNKILNNTVFAEPKQNTSCSIIKTIAITLMRNSSRNYKTLFQNAGMGREYNYFKRTKEVVIRENNIQFEELRMNLVPEAAPRAG